VLIVENGTREFYDPMAEFYHLIFMDWEKSIDYHASVIDDIFKNRGKPKTVSILDCACGIGTQALGLAQLGYNVSGSDISESEITRAKLEAAKRDLNIDFRIADFCALDSCFENCFDVIIAMDNALPHLLYSEDLKSACKSIYAQTTNSGVFIASIRNYDELLISKPSSTSPSVIPTPAGKRIVFQLWQWQEDIYDLTQYIIEDENGKIETHKFDGTYRALTRKELTAALLTAGFHDVNWIFPQESRFYQPIVVAKK